MSHRWHLAFHSGMSASSDLRAAVDVGVPIGVVAPLLSLSKVFLALPRHLDSGGSVFIDSGAFAAFQKGETVIWERVFQKYESVILMTAKPQGLSIVAPDVIGDQVATLKLWSEHAERVKNWIGKGVRVIVPLQRGALDAAQMLALAKDTFGSDRFCVGVPSNLEAMSAGDCSTLHHSDFHILGRVVMTDELVQKIDALKANNPDANYTADANWLRARTRKISIEVSSLAPDRSSGLGDTKRTRAVRNVLQQEAYYSLLA
ncbi:MULTISPECIES: hypothetical protein [Pseudomonas]|uniref:Uncharacterized protein n=2 Tax=Pseudomonas TaxID=286 RepID=A0A9X4HAW6_9PSED|nr:MULTISPECIES: hypothetical protein [Pseudomonas]MDD1009360.1 hypothetical protein [Pseudomonas shahriarae]